MLERLKGRWRRRQRQGRKKVDVGMEKQDKRSNVYVAIISLKWIVYGEGIEEGIEEKL